MVIQIDNRQSREPIDNPRLRKAIRVILNALGCPDGELSLSIVDDAEMASLNRDYRGRPAPTNVIAFAMREGAFSEINPHILGDVVISADTCRREADAEGIGFEERLEDLLVHGVLHLFGFDHEASPEAEARMWRKTDALLDRIRRPHPDAAEDPPE